jgi:hypothetical protein
MVVVLKNKLKKFFVFWGQTNPMSSTIMGFLFLSKGATNSFKPIYKCHGQQWGIFFILL